MIINYPTINDELCWDIELNQLLAWHKVTKVHAKENDIIDADTVWHEFGSKLWVCTAAFLLGERGC